jgi:hypothetical protein
MDEKPQNAAKSTPIYMHWNMYNEKKIGRLDYLKTVDFKFQI